MTEREWNNVQRLVKVGAWLIAGTVAVTAFAAKLDGVEARVTEIEASGSKPFQVSIRAVQDTVAAMRSDQRVIRYLLCQMDEVKRDSACEGVRRPAR